MKRIVLFDGECNFCNSSVQFIIKRDPAAHFLFTSLQSDIGQKYVKQYRIPADVDSIVLIENERAYTKSSAALHIAKKLDGLWHLLFLFILVPRFIRDGVYDYVAENRYRWFGKNEDACMLPSPEIRKRFI
ncbi:DCC1-like thiol-disulfide oxidoreductase family protein [Sporosarcina thermotolerans]|uniref:DCC1-like thiol-disulfide oxidoreductase family protein n=1 Tax=Sporosarcina thermotolerans TaxID=633404 RepID=A0AAW9A7W1_9BACL|nr:DCC1-like thiol-disulfide oxidoreductase family protein [Sporosarcina thermotolerans]MDW0116708.1 DCC1-like thiol-disulfide oxidoreductase family protein [Sporosarcina thermotolerans]WHT48900.1 DCC1-like thiol-disulfide oxidoreductase family protein [Sporosarcina thermotolerans]